jgi:hypothetical protein
MQLLPSCFSIGEGALMAQGAAGLAAAAALVLPQAPLFVPDAVCQLLPAAGLQLVFKAGGCSSTAHSRALSSEALPAAILLVVASTLLLCLLLRALLGVLGCCSSSSSRNTSAACQETKTATISSSSRLCSVLLAVPIVVSMVALLLFLVCAAAWTVLEFVPARQGRLLVLLYWVGLLGVMLPALALWANHSKVPQVRQLSGAAQLACSCQVAKYMVVLLHTAVSASQVCKWRDELVTVGCCVCMKRDACNRCMQRVHCAAFMSQICL